MAPHRKADKPQIISVSACAPTYELEHIEGKKYRRKWTITPPSKEQADKMVWRPILCGGFDVDDAGEKHYHHIECIPCHCTPGPHFWAMDVDAFEVGCGGQRGSGKSEDLLGWLSGGDPASSDERCHATYLNHPDYTFLVLRKNATDLEEFFERAKRYFAHFGGTATDMKITFPSKAFGVFGHLMAEGAEDKYQGNEWTKLSVEEIELIPNEFQYLKVLMACRSKNLAMPARAMVTFNPGGAGAAWIRRRFVHMHHEDGRPVKRYDFSQKGEVYTEPHTGRTRAFVWSRVEDNPYKMMEGYDKQLDMLRFHSETQWRQWRLGDFDAVAGQYFEALRRERRPNEPPAALHVVPAETKLEGWWPRAIGMDWGFSHSSAVVWGCWSPKGQLHIYREMNVRRMGTVEIGSEIARKSTAELEGLPGHHLNIYLSHDAFHRDDYAPTEAEQIASGINSVLGANAAFVYAPLFEEETLDASEAARRVELRRKEMSGRTHITIQRAARNSVAGWNLIRELLRWWPLHQPAAFSEAKAKEFLLAQGQDAFREYMAQYDGSKAEVLPKLLIFNSCEQLLTGLEAAAEDPNNTEKVLKQDGDDMPDALQYLCSMFKFREAEVPFDVALQQKLEHIRQAAPGVSMGALVRVAEQFEAEQARVPQYLRLSRRRAQPASGRVM